MMVLILYTMCWMVMKSKIKTILIGSTTKNLLQNYTMFNDLNYDFMYWVVTALNLRFCVCDFCSPHISISDIKKSFDTIVVRAQQIDRFQFRYKIFWINKKLLFYLLFDFFLIYSRLICWLWAYTIYNNVFEQEPHIIVIIMQFISHAVVRADFFYLLLLLFLYFFFVCIRLNQIVFFFIEKLIIWFN